VFLHWILGIVMVLKLFPEVLAHAEVSVSALQQLEVPKVTEETAVKLELCKTPNFSL